MLQIINISQARNNLAKVVRKVKETGEPVVIVQNSDPAVILYPYNTLSKKDGINTVNKIDYAKETLNHKG